MGKDQHLQILFNWTCKTIATKLKIKSKDKKITDTFNGKIFTISFHPNPMIILEFSIINTIGPNGYRSSLRIMVRSPRHQHASYVYHGTIDIANPEFDPDEYIKSILGAMAEATNKDVELLEADIQRLNNDIRAKKQYKIKLLKHVEAMVKD